MTENEEGKTIIHPSDYRESGAYRRVIVGEGNEPKKRPTFGVSTVTEVTAFSIRELQGWDND